MDTENLVANNQYVMNFKPKHTYIIFILTLKPAFSFYLH